MSTFSPHLQTQQQQQQQKQQLNNVDVTIIIPYLLGEK